MAPEPQVVKGYVKTVNMFWLVIIALAVGFTSGVVFSAYRSSSLLQAGAHPSQPTPSLTPQQQDMLRNLLARTKSDPKDTEAWTHLGHLYFDSDQHDLAISAYRQSLDLDDRRPDVWTDLGVMYRRSGAPEKAIESFERALAIDPRHRIAWFNKGVVLMHDLGDSNRALAAWEELITIDPQAKTPSGQSVRELVDELKKGAS